VSVNWIGQVTKENAKIYFFYINYFFTLIIGLFGLKFGLDTKRASAEASDLGDVRNSQWIRHYLQLSAVDYGAALKPASLQMLSSSWLFGSQRLFNCFLRFQSA